MSVLPSATFAGPALPIFVDGNLPVTISSGELNIENRGDTGSFLSMSPVSFHPPLLSYPTYLFNSFVDNSFNISRGNTPGAVAPDSYMMEFDPVPVGATNNDAENDITMNGNVEIINNLGVLGIVSGFMGLRNQIVKLIDPVDPPIPKLYKGGTLYLEGNPNGNGSVIIELPLLFFSAVYASLFEGSTIFRLVTYNTTTQEVTVTDNLANVLVTVTVNSPCVVEAVRLDGAILTYTTPITSYTKTPLTLVGSGTAKPRKAYRSVR